MYCQACGIAITQQMKYCNRCGVQLISTDEPGQIKPSEKRFDEYLEGLFWITVFGLGIILGGIVLMKKVQLSDWLIVTYLILSTTAFLINFGLSIWGAFRIDRISKEARLMVQAGQLNTNELNPAEARATLQPAPSVTEHTTRSFEPIHRKQAAE